MQAKGIGKRALLIGALWTLAAPAALVWFKSDYSAPIYLWSLGLVALGWAAVLLHALAAAERSANVALAAAGSETRSVIDGVACATDEELQGACKELTRVDELLAHAIGQLLTAFNGVSDQVQAHQRELAEEVAVAQGTPAADRLRATAERVASDVNGAVTALQFRDVVGQKLDHVRRELQALGHLMQKIRALSSTQPGLALAPERAEASGPAALGAGVRALLQHRKQRRAASPVRQELMHAGEVELF